MPFSVSWHTLHDHAEDFPDEASLVTPLSHTRIRIIDVQEHHISIEDIDREKSRPLQRGPFESLYRRITDGPDSTFELTRLPPDADPYPAVWSLHPRFEIDEDAGVIRKTDNPTESQVSVGD